MLRKINTQRFRHEKLWHFINECQDGVRKESKVLDVGCGSGWFLELLAKHGFSDIYGCDYKKNLDFEGFNFELVNLNEQDLPFSDGVFDMVICSDVLEHLENPSRCLRNIRRVVEPEGVVYVTIPNCANILQRLYFLLFGVPGAIAYRVVNTLDAMVGYHGKYEYLGKFASKLDDILNFIPARLTALLLVLASLLLRRDTRASWQVAFSEHSKTESINAGWTMAAVAGALNVQLDKVGHYKLGKAGAPLIPGTIDASLQLMQIAALIWVIICFTVGGICFVLAS